MHDSGVREEIDLIHASGSSGEGFSNGLNKSGIS